MTIAREYLATFDELRRRKRWTTDTTVLRFAALSLASTRRENLGERLEETAAALSEGAGWFDPLRSAVRHIVAALILKSGREPREVARQVAEVREGLRAQRLPRGGTPPTLAALLLVLHDAGPTAAGRVKAIMDRWNADHPFLTGADDLPLAALHATRTVPAETLGVLVESIYRRLNAAGFSRGNALQLVSHLLVIDPRGPDAAVTRFQEVVRVLRDNARRVTSWHYDEVAILALTTAPVPEVVGRVLRWTEELRTARPRPGLDIAFSIACGLALAEDAERVRSLSGASEVGTLAALQAILDAQQAAVIAASTAAITAATVASTS